MIWPTLPNIPTETIHLDTGHSIDILRLDKTDSYISGNKWFKLKYNLLEAKKQGFKSVLTFGGAYSNHIHATAAACHDLQLKCIGIIRGEEHLPLNATLDFAKKRGMTLHYMNRELYRKKHENELILELKKQFGDFFLIPEGGTNSLAIKGTREIRQLFQKKYKMVAIAAGTGGTAAGLADSLKDESNLLVFPVLKGSDFIKQDIASLLNYTPDNVELITDYHFGGYAKTNKTLMDFIEKMNEQHALPLDYIYTGKALYGLIDYLKQANTPTNLHILFIHTGGLQGIQKFAT